MTFDEDPSQVRTGNAPESWPTCRNLVISTLRLAGAPTSPTPAATCTTITTPSPPSEMKQSNHHKIGHLATTPGPWAGLG